MWQAALLLAGCAEPVASAPVDEPARQWRELRALRGHFDGGAFNADIDQWQGRKHVLMQQLAAEALQQRQARDALLQRLGAPDAAWRAGQAEHGRALQQARWQGTPRGDLLAYHWRGTHDRLLFALDDDGRVGAVGWLYTLE